MSPLTTAVWASAPICAVWPPGEAVTTYPVMGEPPSLADGVHDTVASPTPATAFTPVGAEGTANAEPSAFGRRKSNAGLLSSGYRNDCVDWLVEFVLTREKAVA